MSGQRLRVTRAKLRNWRNFAAAEVVLANRVFLVGPNASGKSNLLDVFRFLRDVVTAGGGGLRAAVGKRGGVSSIRSLAAQQRTVIELIVNLGNEDSETDWTYELAFTHRSQKDSTPIIQMERVLRKKRELFRRPDDADREDPERLTETYLERPATNKDFRDIAEFFGSIRYLHIVPQLIREPHRAVPVAHDPYGGDLIERIAKSHSRVRKNRLERIGRALRVAVPQLRDLQLIQHRDGTWHLRGRFEHWRASGAWQTEERFSDGTLRLLGLLWSVLEEEGPLLLEEPELSLHGDLVRNIPPMIARLQGELGRQVIMSTHSVELLEASGIGLHEILVLDPGPKGTTVREASSFREIPVLLRNGLSVAEAVIPRTRPEHAQQLSLF